MKKLNRLTINKIDLEEINILQKNEMKSITGGYDGDDDDEIFCWVAEPGNILVKEPCYKKTVEECNIECYYKYFYTFEVCECLPASQGWH